MSIKQVQKWREQKKARGELTYTKSYSQTSFRKRTTSKMERTEKRAESETNQPSIKRANEKKTSKIC